MAEYQFSKEERNLGKTAKIVIIALLFITVVIYIIIGNIDFSSIIKTSGGESIVFTETGADYKYDAFTNPLFYTYPGAGGYFYATKDGIKFLSESGEVKMSHMYSMLSPQLQGDGNIAAVAEQRGNIVYVFNDGGYLYEASTQNPIISFSVNARGQLSIITQKDDEYRISVYNGTGGLIHENGHPANNIFPVNSDISDDGRLLAVLFYDITGVNVSSKITFFIINKKEAIDYANSVYGLNDDFMDETVYLIKFMTGNMLVTISDKEAACIAAESKCQKIWRFEINNKLTNVFFNSDSFALAFGKGIVNRESEPEGTVKIYNTDLSESSVFLAKGSVTYLSGIKSAYIIGTGRDFSAVNSKGEELWHFNSLTDVSQILFMDNTNKFLLSEETRAVIYKAEKTKTEEEGKL